MSANIPFLFVNITALCCFTLMFVTFLATKKKPEIWAFLAVLLDCILWRLSRPWQELQNVQKKILTIVPE